MLTKNTRMGTILFSTFSQSCIGRFLEAEYIQSKKSTKWQPIKKKNKEKEEREKIDKSYDRELDNSLSSKHNETQI